jgi:hypothetical protein
MTVLAGDLPRGIDFLLIAGGSTAGGGALGAGAGFLGWMASRALYRLLLWLRLVKAVPQLASRTVFLEIGGGIGGCAGFLIWLFEHYQLL